MRPATTRRFDLVFAASVATLVLITIAALWLPVSVASEGLDLAINTVAALAGAGAAGLAWIRYAEFGERPAVLEASAFIVVLTTRGLLVVLALLGLTGPLGLSLDAPQQWPIYAWTLARGVTAILLIVAAMQAIRTSDVRRVPWWAALTLPSLAVVAAAVLLALVEDALPAVIDAAALGDLHTQPGAAGGMTGIGLLAQAAIAVLYLWGAALYRRQHRLGERRYAGYLSIALVVAAFSQLHWAIQPGIYAPAVTVDDFLRVAFSIILLAGIQAQLRGDVGELRRANLRLEALREVEMERVALETRAQLAREVHDGLAQELWFAKLKAGRLQQVDELPPDARELAGEVAAAVDRALGESRVALTAIRVGLDGEAPLGSSLEAYVADFGARAGLGARFEADPDLPPLPPRVSAEVLRIVVEALANVAKHADASSVQVTTRVSGSTYEVVVADNGVGFDVEAVEGARYGLRGMQERAALIGGRLDVTSREGEGTTVTLRIPLGDDAAGEG